MHRSKESEHENQAKIASSKAKEGEYDMDGLINIHDYFNTKKSD